MDMQIIGQLEPPMLEMILRGYIIPKPMGVGMSLTVTQEARTDADREYPEAVSTLVSCDSAKITLRYPLDGLEVQPQLEQVTLFPANNALITLRYPSEDSEAQPPIGQAALLPANIAQITLQVS